MDAKELFNQTTFECSKLITNRYSTSFSLGIKSLDKKFHYPIYAIYGFVRYADEIVDTFHEKDKASLLREFKSNTYTAIKDEISLNPVLHCFQMVVNQYQIDHALIEAFLHSMEMDLLDIDYQQESYEEYIYGSAEVVGLMCLKVFCDGDEKEYQRLLPFAKSLGSAFQKVNFLRDIKSDYYERGRVYFPGVDFNDFSVSHKEKIEADIQKDFDHAYKGIVELPRGARWGVYLAYTYYLKLFDKIKRFSPNKIMEQRVRVPDSKKLFLLLGSYVKHQLNTL
ncbi:phytoene/squalene synthase family protein [Marivirga arenosa]|uniref:Phytoene/squalene synthase family protein n=1 Tax=Marivirga arenosa TaxID=3059076 RepID=A0AA51N4R8_9BACT|nr:MULTISPECIES: phytoene/squalene synthase family protein [unclassified Marivirga]WKK79496.1 phytoene/squalene synthase family protein [Marivirga sp. BKB1-2]WMN06204.1 phytoene/squalene synthase family protein [Marivirga sp. ABR2-2]